MPSSADDPVATALRDAATRDFVRSELRSLLEEMEEKGLEVRLREQGEEGGPAKG